MGVLGWILVGFIAGGLARRAVGAEKRGCLGTIVIGIIGALLGGALFRFATGDELGSFDEFDLASVFVAFVGACLLLLLLGGRRSRRHGHGHHGRR